MGISEPQAREFIDQRERVQSERVLAQRRSRVGNGASGSRQSRLHTHNAHCVGRLLRAPHGGIHRSPNRVGLASNMGRGVS